MTTEQTLTNNAASALKNGAAKLGNAVDTLSNSANHGIEIAESAANQA